MYYSEQEFNNLIKTLPGVKVIKKINRVYLLSVDNYGACKALFDKKTISWCIAQNISHWNDYISYPGNKQYFIVDFNNIESENKEKYNNSLIGFTIDKRGGVYAAHARNDNNLLSHSASQVFKTMFESCLMEKKLYNFVICSGMQENEKTPSMVPVYLLVGSIILASLTLFIH